MGKDIFDDRNDSYNSLLPSTGHSNSHNLPAARPVGLTGWLLAKANGTMLNNALAEATHEEFRALLAKQGMENIGVVAACMANIVALYPECTEHCKMLLDTFAVSAISRIGRW